MPLKVVERANDAQLTHSEQNQTDVKVYEENYHPLTFEGVAAK